MFVLSITINLICLESGGNTILKNPEIPRIDKTCFIVRKNEVKNLGNERKENDILKSNEDVLDGYLLMAPEFSTKTYLINREGKIVHTWTSTHIQGLGVYLLENGNLFRSCSSALNWNFTHGGAGGYVELFDWNGTVIWEFEYVSDNYCMHNDILPLPNGNILIGAWERKTSDEVIAAGGDPQIQRGKDLLIDHIIEVQPNGSKGGNIVWEWHVWDHLIQDYDSSKENYGVIKEHPELIDINSDRIIRNFFGWGMSSYIFYREFRSYDFCHLNSFDYNEELDQILISVRNLNEIWVIDHNTTIEEAASHSGGRYGKGGDILYRWGNPEHYAAGTSDDQQLFAQHDARWVKAGCPGAGHIAIFNNGIGRPGLDHSSVIEIIPPLNDDGTYCKENGHAYGPEEPVWEYSYNHPFIFYSLMCGSVQKLPNGNIFICSGWRRGLFLEVNHEKEIVWSYVNLRPFPGINNVFKFQWYPVDYPGLKNLTNLT